MKKSLKTVARTMRPAAVRLMRIAAGLGYTPPEALFKHLHFNGPFDMALPTGGSVRLQSWGNRVENELAWRGWNGHEPVERARWVALVSEGGDVLDIGANTGTFAFTAKAVAPSSRVVAFEPIERIAARIETNRQVSGLDVTLERAAVSDQPGELPIYDPGGANTYSASLDPDFLGGDKDSYTVPVTSIDAYCGEHGLNPRTVKMDIEGAEGRAFLGAEQTLAKGRIRILCEWLGNGGSHAEAVALLRRSNYAGMTLHDLSEFDFEQETGFEDRNILIAHVDELARLRQIWQPI